MTPPFQGRYSTIKLDALRAELVLPWLSHARVANWYCHSAVLVIYRDCLGGALEMFWKWTGFRRVLYRTCVRICFGRVLVLDRYLSGIVLALYWCCTGGVQDSCLTGTGSICHGIVLVL